MITYISNLADKIERFLEFKSSLGNKLPRGIAPYAPTSLLFHKKPLSDMIKLR